MRLNSSQSSFGRRAIGATLIASLAVGLMAGSAFAGKGGGGGKPSGGGGTLSGPVMVSDANTNGAANHGDDITFNVSSSAGAPFVGLRCYQGGTWVYDAYVGYFSSYIGDRFFRLSSDYWNPALSTACTARLFYNDSRGREHVQSSLTFTVAP